MGLTLKETGGNFELCPAGTHQARCYVMADLGTQVINYNGEPKMMQKVVLIWEIAEKMQDGRPFAISQIYTSSLSEKANLRKDLESWRGRPFTAEELQGFKLVNVLGAGCFVNIIHQKDKQGRDRANISSIMALPKGVPAIEAHNPIVYFDFDDFDPAAFASLPEWVQTMIKKSPEYAAASNGGYPPIVDDEPPMHEEPPAF